MVVTVEVLESQYLDTSTHTTAWRRGQGMVLWLLSPFADGVGLLVVGVAGATVGDSVDGAAAARLFLV